MTTRTIIELDAESESDMELEFSSINEMTTAIEEKLRNEGVEFETEYAQIPGSRGGPIEFLTASAPVIAALAPIIVAWFESRAKKVETTREIRADGTIIEKIKVTSGGG